MVAKAMSCALVGLVALAGVSDAPGQPSSPRAPALAVGAPAPALGVDHWLKGGALRSFEPGRVYVVEFWATWCTPCVANIPHLTGVARRHPSVTVLGVAINESRGKGREETVRKLESFVASKGAEMGYVVGYDHDGDMDRAWLNAAGLATIPAAFIVGPTGRLEWIGNPAARPDEFEAALRDALDRAPMARGNGRANANRRPDSIASSAAKATPTNKASAPRATPIRKLGAATEPR